MKKFIAGLLMVPCMAFAESWSMKNQNGGEIVITDRACKINGKDYSPLKEAYSYWSGGYMSGCWYIEDSMIKIIWSLANGNRAETRVYQFNDFTQKSGGSRM